MNNKPNFTEGDWKLQNGNEIYCVIHGTDGKVHALPIGMVYEHPWMEQNEVEANKNLMVAAKDLYNSLTFKSCIWGKDLAELLEFVADNRDREAAKDGSIECLSPILREYAIEIRKALNKAKGIK